MSYDQWFETGVKRSGTRYVAHWDGEWCGEHDTYDKARKAVALRDKAHKAAQALDRVARPYFCDGRYGVWRAIEAGQTIAPAVTAAFDAHHKAVTAFNRAIGRA